ncbi:MAG: helix-turn-helix domain-containing protein [Candidatus Anammoxibacter sp.]
MGILNSKIKALYKAQNEFEEAKKEALEHLGFVVRDTRKLQSITQEQLATRIGVSRATIANIELGRQNVNAEQIILLSTALNTTPDRMLGF